MRCAAGVAQEYSRYWSATAVAFSAGRQRPDGARRAFDLARRRPSLGRLRRNGTDRRRPGVRARAGLARFAGLADVVQIAPGWTGPVGAILRRWRVSGVATLMAAMALVVAVTTMVRWTGPDVMAAVAVIAEASAPVRRTVITRIAVAAVTAIAVRIRVLGGRLAVVVVAAAAAVPVRHAAGQQRRGDDRGKEQQLAGRVLHGWRLVPCFAASIAAGH